MEMPLSFSCSDEQQMLADMLRRFSATENDFEKRSHRLKSSPPERMALWPALCDLGTLAALVTEEAGGYGGRPSDLAVVQEAMAASLLVEPVLTSGVICNWLLLNAENELRQVRDALIAGTVVVALAFAEGFDPFAMPSTRAEAHDGHFLVSGVKPAVRHADVATHLLIGVTLDGAAALFLVPAGAPGVKMSITRLIDGAGAADINLNSVNIADSDRLIFENLENAVADALHWGLAGLAVETAALIEACNRATFDYLNVREQFGTKLAAFQALQHMAANMAIAGEEAAAMATSAIYALSIADRRERSVAVLRASLACDAAGRFASHTAVQLFGGMGVSDELFVSHYARRLTAIRSQIGTRDARAARLTALEGNE